MECIKCALRDLIKRKEKKKKKDRALKVACQSRDSDLLYFKSSCEFA